jgi:tetratricopeptide (TPR) repeat protein
MMVVLGGCAEEAPRAGAPGQSPRPAEAAGKPGPGPSRLNAKALAEFNRGGALMEQYQYGEAAQAYETVVGLEPAWTAARFNLGLAYFNMLGQSGAAASLEKARKVFEEVLASEPNHLPARFCLGLYWQHLGNAEKCLECFQAARQADSRDPYIAYKCAEALLSLGRNDEGTAMLEKVVALDPGFISGVYRLATQYQRTNRAEKAARLFERFKQLNEAELTGGSFVVQKTYGTIGKYYQALEADGLGLPARAAPARRIVFSPEVKFLDAPAAAWKWAGGAVNLPGIAVGDVDRDGRLDVCLTGMGADGAAAIWFNVGSGRFKAGPVIAQQGVSPCFGDVDDDGRPDLWLGCAGANVLLKNDGKGAMTKVAAPAAAGGDALTHCARLVDIDSDGGLDLVALRLAKGSVPATGDLAPAPAGIYGNNRDGSFRDMASGLGLAFADTPVACVAFDDFDDDRDLDLAIFPGNGGLPVVWVNDRAGAYRILDANATGLNVRGGLSATTGDANKDGRRDLLIFTGGQVHLFINRGGFQFEEHQGFAKQFGRLGGTGGQFVDIDNDGNLDILIADAHRRDGTRGPALLLSGWPQDRFADATELDPGNVLSAIHFKGDAGCVAADFTGDGRCDLLFAPAGEKPFLLENTTRGGHWIELDLSGTRTQDRKSRSNGSAVGARVEVKAGPIIQQFVVGAASGPVAMPPYRIHAGLGDCTKVDWLRILWPDGVLQAELEIPGDRVAPISEMSRKTSSCPQLFAWDGSHFEFVADFGGKGGLGYLVAPGTFAPPDPVEYLPVPRLKPRDGQYVLQVLEPLEEAAYLDEASLIAVDHPAGTEVYPNEMMAVSAAPPRFEVFCVSEPIEPLRAVDHRGAEVTDAIRRADRRCAGATGVENCFVGFAEDHFVELDFGDRLQALPPGARLVLFLYGWVEYGYSSTNYAAGKAGLRLKAPSIHVLRDGRWVELFRQVGYPAGIQHMMTLEVTGRVLPTDRKIRISSNMEVYWDRIFLGVHQAGARLSLKAVPAASADLHFLGYPREYSPDGRQPNLYDYSNIDTTLPWKVLAGRYTRFGDVTELLREADDCYVIMGPGEEISLRFPADAFGAVPEGLVRTFILKTDGYCKDMDLYTACPDTVEPLPFHKMTTYPYGASERYPDTDKTRAYRHKFNTRQLH